MRCSEFMSPRLLLKKKWLGLDTMQVWDRNAPLPMEDPKIVDWPTAEKMVMDAYTAFDPRMGALAEPFFRKGWIDAGVKPGKAPGAFAHPTVTDVHPYVMLNYLGKPRDVMTLAHELGHGVHQVLAAGQGEMLSSTPLTLAETASVFGEMLTFRKMLENAKTKSERKILHLVRNEARNIATPLPARVSQTTLFAARQEVLNIHMAPAVEEYILQLVMATRHPERYSKELASWIDFGASPRGTIALDLCSRAHAWLKGNDFVSPEDVHEVVRDVLRHRVLLSFEAEAAGVDPDKVLGVLLELVPTA